MKLAGREAKQFCTRPLGDVIGALIYGPDAGMIAARRRDLVSAIMGADTDDMRLTSIPAAEARKSGAIIDEALRARGFFPGRRIVVIEGGTDGLAKPLKPVLEHISTEDAFLIVTADALAAKSPLRGLFEKDRRLASLAFYPDAMDGPAIADALRDKGLSSGITKDALLALEGFAREMDYGSFDQFLTKLATTMLGHDAALDADCVLAQAPGSMETEIDRLITAIAGGQAEQIGPLVQSLSIGGAGAVQMLIMAGRHFRQLLRAASADGGPENGIAAIRPPLWGPRRTAFASQLRRWDRARLEAANRQLFETDSKVRSAAQTPELALVERCFLRIALMSRAR